MLIYVLLLYVCNSRPDPKGTSTLTRVVIIDRLCRLSPWGVSLPSTTNYYRRLFRSFSQARTLVASLQNYLTFVGSWRLEFLVL